ncbi:hypothetical protein SDJN03_13470, partial [Cucurbita argyrosperma subsp. sororia]
MRNLNLLSDCLVKEKERLESMGAKQILSSTKPRRQMSAEGSTVDRDRQPSQPCLLGSSQRIKWTAVREKQKTVQLLEEKARQENSSSFNFRFGGLKLFFYILWENQILIIVESPRWAL